MTKTSDIKLTVRTSGWVEITNNGSKHSGRNSFDIMKFLDTNSRYMDSVCFGTMGVPNMGSLAIKIDRVPGFIAYAAKHGFKVEMGA